MVNRGNWDMIILLKLNNVNGLTVKYKLDLFSKIDILLYEC